MGGLEQVWVPKGTLYAEVTPGTGREKTPSAHDGAIWPCDTHYIFLYFSVK